MADSRLFGLPLEILNQINEYILWPDVHLIFVFRDKDDLQHYLTSIHKMDIEKALHSRGNADGTLYDYAEYGHEDRYNSENKENEHNETGDHDIIKYECPLSIEISPIPQYLMQVSNEFSRMVEETYNSVQKKLLALVKPAVQDINTVRARFTQREPESEKSNLRKVLRQAKFVFVGDARDGLSTIEKLPRWVTNYIEYVLIRPTVPHSPFDLGDDKWYRPLQTGEVRNKNDANWKLYPERIYALLTPKIMAYSIRINKPFWPDILGGIKNLLETGSIEAGEFLMEKKNSMTSVLADVIKESGGLCVDPEGYEVRRMERSEIVGREVYGHPFKGKTGWELTLKSPEEDYYQEWHKKKQYI
ncbi:hypothetical protein AA313_de0208400 [Arthrobotrys entomopaga]|nr:hypothetical protein AA313_de0208400 [Arthrobotrys entomopaga]